MMRTGTLTKRSKIIYVYDKENNLIDEVIGLSNVSRKYGIRFQNLYKTLNGYKTSLNGFNFSYEKIKQ